MAVYDEAAQGLEIPIKYLKGYKANYALSYSENRKEWQWYPSKLAKVMRNIVGAFFIAAPFGITLQYSTDGTLLILLAILLIGGLICEIQRRLSWEIYFRRTLSGNEAYKELAAFFSEYWIELSMFPYIEKIVDKIRETEMNLADLKEHYIKSLTLSEAPNIHPEILEETKGSMVILEANIELQEVVLEFYQSLEHEFYAIKTTKEQSEEIQESLSKIGEGKPIEHEKYLKRLSKLQEIQLKAENIEVNTKLPQSAKAAYEHLLELVEG